jgi:uncharacterized protein (DUF433 family)
VTGRNDAGRFSGCGPACADARLYLPRYAEVLAAGNQRAADQVLNRATITETPYKPTRYLALRNATLGYMSQPLSVRLNDATLARLGSRARRAHLPPRTLAQRYVEEGLRMDEHPLIRFSDGPAGRRARLVGTGKDVWEIIAVVRDNDADPAEAARYLEIPLGLIQAAISYYGTYTSEIDQLIDLNEQEAAEAHAAYAAGQAALRQ